MADEDRAEFNRRTIEEFRANGGVVGGDLAGTKIILVHHKGAKSGIERITPLAVSDQGDGRYVIIASNGGSPTHPHWVHNLRAHPRITVEVGTETFPVLVEELDGPARDEVWRKLVEQWPSIVEFHAKVERQIPLFLLTRQD